MANDEEYDAGYEEGLRIAANHGNMSCGYLAGIVNGLTDGALPDDEFEPTPSP